MVMRCRFVHPEPQPGLRHHLCLFPLTCLYLEGGILLPCSLYQQAGSRNAGVAQEALLWSGMELGNISIPSLPSALSLNPLLKLELSLCSSKCFNLGFLGSIPLSSAEGEAWGYFSCFHFSQETIRKQIYCGLLQGSSK